MKKLILIFTILNLFLGCTKNESNEINSITIRGKVERELNNEGIPNQIVLLRVIKSFGSGFGYYTKEIDSKVIITNSNGDFSVTMKNDSNTYLTVYKYEDENYEQFGLSSDLPNNIFAINSDVVLKVNKFIKFKIFVKNINPFDVNDNIDINFFAGNKQSYRTNIENLGVQNIIIPAENLSGGGSFGSYEKTSWNGTNVNSIVYYNVPENADQHKIIWKKRKNGMETTGFTNEIPIMLNQINEYNFNY